MTRNDRFFEIKINDGATITTKSLNSGGWDGNRRGTYTLQVELQEGDNEITLGNANDDAPNLDKIDLSFNDEATGINFINTQKQNKVYNINGQRIYGKPSTPGIYIIDGKKVLEK